jgi:hypothetical protein
MGRPTSEKELRAETSFFDPVLVDQINQHQSKGKNDSLSHEVAFA